MILKPFQTTSWGKCDTLHGSHGSLHNHKDDFTDPLKRFWANWSYFQYLETEKYATFQQICSFIKIFYT